MGAGTYVLVVISPLNAALNYLLVYTFNIGLLGAPIATSISYWLSFLGLVLYARFVRGSDHWGGWSRKCIHNLWTFTRLALPGILQIGTEWWAFEIIALVAGQLGKTPLAAQSVIMSADQMVNTIPFGVGVALSARVGNLLGDHNPRGAARAAHLGAVLSMMLGAIVLAILMATRRDFARIFNDNQDVVDLTAEVLPAVALFQIADGLNNSCGGSLRGMGRQHIGAAVNVVSYYCLALPLGIWMAWHGWGLQGLWWGNCAALYITGTLEWLLVALTNWKKQMKNALGRLDAPQS